MAIGSSNQHVLCQLPARSSLPLFEQGCRQGQQILPEGRRLQVILLVLVVQHLQNVEYPDDSLVQLLHCGALQRLRDFIGVAD